MSVVILLSTFWVLVNDVFLLFPDDIYGRILMRYEFFYFFIPACLMSNELDLYIESTGFGH